MHTEIELKLRLPLQGVSQLQRSQLIKSLSVSPAITQKLYTVYYDTESHDLRRKDIALRLRLHGKRWVQTIKGRGGARAGLHQRYEWEVPVPQPTPDFTKISDPTIINFFDSASLREKLHPLFTTEFNRSKRMLRLTEGEVEFCLDRGTITAGGASILFSEIELELKSGNPALLFQLALDLLAIVPLRLENRSKAERGYALSAGFKCLPGKAPPVNLHGGMSLSSAFNAITANCLNHLLSNESGMLEGCDIEYLHQMRVAVRRQRSVLSIFSPLFATESASVARELRWLTRQIGPARDWDMFVTETLPLVLGAFPQHSGMVSLRDQCEELRLRHASVGRRAVESKRYTKMMLKLGAWISAESGSCLATSPPHGLASDSREKSLQEFAEELLTRRHDKLKKYGRKLKHSSSNELHELRIAVKKQRYAIEFFAGLYADEAPQRYSQSLTKLQDILGTMNDVATVGRLLEELPSCENDSSVHQAAGIILGWGACRALVKKRELGRAWESFYNIDPFWQKPAACRDMLS
jgi:inorganic triphosphatase YgiF